MTALTAERDTKRLGAVEAAYGAEGKLVIKDNVKLFNGALLMKDENGEVLPGGLGLSKNLTLLGRCPKTIDNVNDGELTEVDRGTFQWILSSSDAKDIHKIVYVLDDQTVSTSQHGSGTPQVDTVTPTPANDTGFRLTLLVDEHGEGDWNSFSIFALGDGTATATEICDAWRAQLTLITALSGVLTGSGTTTLVLTGAEGVRFETLDSGVGVSGIVLTTPGVYVDRPRAGTVVGFDATGVYVQPDV